MLKLKCRESIGYAISFLLICLLPTPSTALNTTVSGVLGDLDRNGDGGTAEAAVLQTAVNCWSARVSTNRNFTLTVASRGLIGGTFGIGNVAQLDGNNIPTRGFVEFDADGSTAWFVDPTPLTSLEFTPDPQNQWRFSVGPPPGPDLLTLVLHEIGHAFGWVCGDGACPNISNPHYNALMVPQPGMFVANTTVHLVSNVGANPLNVPLRGDGMEGPSLVINELSHTGIATDLMEGFFPGSARELPSFIDVNLFFHAYGDTLNLPPTINAGPDITPECNAIGGANVMLDGSGSTDPEAQPLNFSWTCPGVALVNTNTDTPTGFFNLSQTVTCRADVTDLAACPAQADTVPVTVVDTIAPTITCPAATAVECKQAGGTPDDDPDIAAFLAGATATDVCDSSLPIADNAPAFFNNGMTTVSFATADDSGNSASCTSILTVQDTIPHTISAVSASPNVLSPANHKMVPVTVAASVSDACDATPVCTIISVSSNEPISGLGGGDRAPDWEITGDLTVNLRAERSRTGNGRVYTITIQCTDASGSSSTKDVIVTVPRR